MCLNYVLNGTNESLQEIPANFSSIIPPNVYFYATVVVAVVLVFKSYGETLQEWSESYPRGIIVGYIVGSITLMCLCLNLAVELNTCIPIADVNTQLLRSALVSGSIFMLFGPLLILTPVNKKVVRSKFFKKIVEVAQKKETRYLSLFFFTLMTASQGLATYAIYISLTNVFGLASVDAAGVSAAHALVCLFYLAAFYATMMKKELTLLKSIRSNIKWLELPGYLFWYVRIFWIVIIACIAVAIVFFVQDIQNNNRYADIRNRSALILTAVLFSVSVCGIIACAAFLLVECYRTKEIEENVMESIKKKFKNKNEEMKSALEEYLNEASGKEKITTTDTFVYKDGAVYLVSDKDDLDDVSLPTGENLKFTNFLLHSFYDSLKRSEVTDDDESYFATHIDGAEDIPVNGTTFNHVDAELPSKKSKAAPNKIETSLPEKTEFIPKDAKPVIPSKVDMPAKKTFCKKWLVKNKKRITEIADEVKISRQGKDGKVPLNKPHWLSMESFAETVNVYGYDDDDDGRCRPEADFCYRPPSENFENCCYQRCYQPESLSVNEEVETTRKTARDLGPITTRIPLANEVDENTPDNEEEVHTNPTDQRHQTTNDSCTVGGKKPSEYKSPKGSVVKPRSSRGSITFPNGDSYEGDIVDGKMYGQGKLHIFSTQDVYEGEFCNDQAHGKGTMVYGGTGNRYEGSWESNHRHGPGTFYWESSGFSYTGLYVKGEVEGPGSAIIDGNTWSGTFENGSLSGTGSIKFANGEIYDGLFKNGFCHVRGLLRYASGAIRYDGQYHEGKRQGVGALFYDMASNKPLSLLSNADCVINIDADIQSVDSADVELLDDLYTATVAKDVTATNTVAFGSSPPAPAQFASVVINQSAAQDLLQKGKQGERFSVTRNNPLYTGYASSNITPVEQKIRYIGQFDDDAYQGSGQYYTLDGSMYDGLFAANVCTGPGRFSFACGDVFEGIFQKNLFHGPGGTYRHAQTCSKYTGGFVNDKYCSLNAKYAFDDGGYYCGSFKNDAFYGEGTYYYNNGQLCFTGLWQNNLMNSGKYYYDSGQVQFEGCFDTEGKMCAIGQYTFRSGIIYVGNFLNSYFHGQGKLKFTNGDLLECESFQKDTPSGEGAYYFYSGALYQGTFSNGKFHGFGCYYYSNEFFKHESVLLTISDHYKGTFENDRFVKGLFRFYSKEKNSPLSPKWDEYDGSFVNDVFSCTTEDATFTFVASGNFFKGSFSQGMFTKGAFFLPGKAQSYQGLFGNDLYHGEGTYKYEGDHYPATFFGTFESGSFAKGVLSFPVENENSIVPRYDGAFSHDLYHGLGTYYYENGDRFDGAFLVNHFKGPGTFVFSMGDSFQGMFDDDDRFSEGVYSFGYGGSYKGTFSYGKFEKGIYNFNGASFEGSFSDDNFCRGTYVFSHGDTYTGRFDDRYVIGNNNEKIPTDTEQQYIYGEGTYTFKAGEAYDGAFTKSILTHLKGRTFSNGDKFEIIEKKLAVLSSDTGNFDGSGVYTFKNGDIYKGEFMQNMFQGKGEYTHSSQKAIYDGLFENDERHGNGSFYLFKADEEVLKILNEIGCYRGTFAKNDKVAGKGSFFKNDKDAAKAQKIPLILCYK